MKISLNWLAEYITWETADPQEIARRFTAHVAEVEEVEVRGKYLRDCCVAKILTLGKHPNADKLSLCTLQTDKGEKRVVCGGSNLREGMKVAFAHVGATVKHGAEEMTLAPVKIRGETSEGMICAAEELDLDEQFPVRPEQGARPIIDLGDGDEGVGTPLGEYLGMNDAVMHVSNHAITNRPDLFSHLGVARECVAIGLAKEKRRAKAAEPKWGKQPLPFKFEVKEPTLMPRYLGCLLEIDGLGETPEWMKKHLAAVGVRSLSLPVDITNYVSGEVGVPLHSFDADDFRGDITFRTAKAGEKITTLDGVERSLPAGALILNDDEGIFDLLGIMGGLRSSTKDSTRRIYLHAASLDPVSIRRAMIATGHRTDAGTVYEKGVPPVTTEQGFLRAVQLFLELVPGTRIVSVLESAGENGKAAAITLPAERVSRFLGANIPAADITRILESLGCVVSAKKDAYVVTPPLWRLRDLTGAHDLLEEIGRVYGYDRIEAALPDANIAPVPLQTKFHRVRDGLKGQRYMELLPLSLVGPTLLEKAGENVAHAVAVENPLGEEFSLLQTSVLPRLLEHAGRYARHQTEPLRTFTAAHVCLQGTEYHQFGMVLAATSATSVKEDAFLLLKQELESVFAEANFRFVFSKTTDLPGFAHPGRCADVSLQGEHVGYVFEVHPHIAAEFGLEKRTCAALLDLERVLTKPVKERTQKVLPNFPAITYDETFAVHPGVTLEAMLAKARAASELLEDVTVADLYSGTPYKGGDYKLTVRCTYRSPERTLTEAETKTEHAKVLLAFAPASA